MVGGENAAVVGNDIASLPRNEQESLIVELTDYADFLIRTRAHWIARGVLPRGYDGASLAMEALSRVLEGRRRPWDPQKEPTLLAYLKSVVKSIFSELLEAATRESVEVAPVDSADRDLVAAAASTDAGAISNLSNPNSKEEVGAKSV